MHARMVSAQVNPEDVDKVVTAWKAAVAPSVRQQPGFRGARVLVTRASGKITSMGFWETEADFEATVEWNQEQLVKFTAFFTSSPEIDHYEVAAEA